jgi:hypothetical protein
MTFQQTNTKLFLQRGYLPAKGWLAEMEALGGMAEV